jgi:multidrug resistance efflux pump
MSMFTDLEPQRAARDQARAEWETLDAGVRRIRAQLTEAERHARKALRAFERARLEYVEAADALEDART